MKKKFVQKHIVSALAVGIGAGIVLSPVTAKAADGDDNASAPDEGAVNNDTSTQTTEETSQAQEYSEASTAAQQDTDNAHKAINAAEVKLNDAALDNPQYSDTYQSANSALSDADSYVGEAAQNLSNTENFNETVKELINNVQEDNDSLQSKADSAADSYVATTNTANEAKETAESIDAETTSLEDAEKAVSDAEALIDQAEQEKAAADELLSRAESDASKPDEDMVAIEAAITENEADLAAAEENLQNAEDALADAKAAVDSTKPTEQEKYDLEHNMWQNIINRKAELAAMSEADERYQTKLKELADIILNEYVLSDNDPFFSRNDYRDGKLNFEYTFSNGEMTIILPELEEGYYTSLGEKINISAPGVVSIKYPEYNEAYVSDTSDPDSFIEAESHGYETKVNISESSEGSTYELYEKIEGSDKPARLEGLENYEGYTGTVSSDIPVAIKIHHEADFNKYKVKTVIRDEGYVYDINDVLYDTHNNYYHQIIERVIQESLGSDAPLSLDTDVYDEYNKPGYTISGDEEHGYTLKLHFISKVKVDGTFTLDAPETYKATRCFYKEGYEEQTVANTAKGQIKKDLDAQIANVQKLQEKEDAISAYNTAITNVTKAKNAVTALQEKGKALAASLREKASREAANTALAKSKLEIATVAKEKAQTAIDQAKAAIQDASSKVSQIKERLEKEKAEKESIEKEKAELEKAEKEKSEKEKAEIEASAAGGSGSDNTGSSSTSGESASADSTIDAASTNILPAAATAPISAETPVLAIGTDSRAAVLGASRTLFYKNLSEELTRQILENKNAAAKAAANEYVRQPGDMAKDTVNNQSESGVPDTAASLNIAGEEAPLAEAPQQKAPTLPLAIALLFAAAMGISAEEYYRRKSGK